MSDNTEPQQLRITIKGRDDPVLQRLRIEANGIPIDIYAEKQYGALMVENYSTGVHEQR